MTEIEPGTPKARSYVYDSAFQNMASRGSAHAARLTISAVLRELPIRSVIDLGCARGKWLREWRARGVAEIVGVDGDYVDRLKLEIDPASFLVHDLTSPFTHSRRFDLAQSLEVAEHLPRRRAASFVDDLVALAPIVLFSAATPGQGGEHHINEQPVEYWRGLFREREYIAIDCFRPLLARESSVPAWYKYNMLLYVRHDILDTIPSNMRYFELSANEAVSDPSPALYKIRKRLVSALPRGMHDWLAQINARRFRTDA